jgi:hypothetical protein
MSEPKDNKIEAFLGCIQQYNNKQKRQQNNKNGN